MYIFEIVESSSYSADSQRQWLRSVGEPSDYAIPVQSIRTDFSPLSD